MRYLLILALMMFGCQTVQKKEEVVKSPKYNAGECLANSAHPDVTYVVLMVANAWNKAEHRVQSIYYVEATFEDRKMGQTFDQESIDADGLVSKVACKGGPESI